jgi:hypothetical protein
MLTSWKILVNPFLKILSTSKDIEQALRKQLYGISPRHLPGTWQWQRQ